MAHRYLLCIALFLSGCEIIQKSSGYAYDTAAEEPMFFHSSLWSGSFNVPSESENNLRGTESYTYVERSTEKEDYACMVNWNLNGGNVEQPLCEECVFEVRIVAQRETDSIDDGTCEDLLDANFVYAFHENYQDSGATLLYRALDESDFQPFIQSSEHSADFAAELTLEDGTFHYRAGYYQYILP